MGPSKKKALPTRLPLELKGNGRTYAGHAIVEEVLESLKSNAELGSATEACLARAYDYNWYSLSKSVIGITIF